MREAFARLAKALFRVALTLASIAVVIAMGEATSYATAAHAPPRLSPDEPPPAPLTVKPPDTPIFDPPPFGRLLVVVDHAGDPKFEQNTAEGAMVVFRHFARRTEWMYVDDLTPDEARAADVVVYLGFVFHEPERGWRNLRYAKRLVVSDLHLAELQQIGLFPHLAQAQIVSAQHAQIEYRGQRFAVAGNFYTRFVARGVPVFGSIEGTARSPFAVIDGSAAFIAAPLDFGRDIVDPYDDGGRIAALDALREVLGLRPAARVALLRLEDVSVQVPSDRMWAIVRYLASRHLPYGIGVIPDQLIKGVTLKTLPEDPDLVAALRFAQDHGARIVLHGLHHSFNSPEDYEFWDNVHNRPLPEDSVAWMSGKLNAGLTIERGLGLHPLMWESPHYAASPLDYRVIRHFFTASWERRRPVAFAPWPLDNDEYHSILLPENLGYISLSDQAMTLPKMLARARALTVCQDCVAAGFLHPATVALADVIDYINGLQALGYRFVDPMDLIAPRTDVALEPLPTSPPAPPQSVEGAALAHDADAGDVDSMSALFYSDMKAKRDDEAVVYGRKYLLARPDDNAFAIDLAYELIAVKKIDEALDVAMAHDSYVRSHPEATKLYADLYYAFSQAKRDDGATVIGKRYIALDPNDDKFAVDLAYSFINVNKADDARLLLSSRDGYLRAHPDGAGAWLALAALDEAAKRPRDAAADKARYAALSGGR